MDPSSMYRSARKSGARLHARAVNARPVHLRTRQPRRGRALLYYIATPYRERGDKRVPGTHTHHWESLQMGRALLHMGYDLDVMSAWNRSWTPRHRYDVMVASRWNVERLAPLLGEGCVKVLYAEVAHIAFQNAGEARRLVELQDRRGVTLRPRRYEMPCRDAESSDVIFSKGNPTIQQTYAFAGRPIRRIHGTALRTFPWDGTKDFTRRRRGFLWMGSWGLVLKGLDLVLEAFAGMPEYDLFVCGPIAKEEDFAAEYRQELQDTPNIHLLGWLDLAGQEFRDVLSNCVAQVNFSASEGAGGSVLTGMHAGLIPVVNPETAVDVEPEYGVLSPESSVEAIQAAVRTVGSASATEVERMARSAWDFVRARHTREHFAEEFPAVLKSALAASKRPSP